MTGRARTGAGGVPDARAPLLLGTDPRWQPLANEAARLAARRRL